MPIYLPVVPAAAWQFAGNLELDFSVILGRCAMQEKSTDRLTYCFDYIFWKY